MSKEEAHELERHFKSFRDHFEVPTFASMGIDSSVFEFNKETIYMSGNSLGLMPKRTRIAVNRELDAWAKRAVESHFRHPEEGQGGTLWVAIDHGIPALLAPLLGAKESEVAAMGTLTSNLNSMLLSFYKPTGKRNKILFEKQAFPSDYYALLNMVKIHGLDESLLLQLEKKPGRTFLLTEDILLAIDSHKEEIALVCFSGIHFYTGQLFDIEAITRRAKQYQIPVGWDLAHVVGNVPVRLHDWGVDFAVFCSYKYLNAGPGGIAGIFVHEKHTENNSKDFFSPRLAGWWGVDLLVRFQMREQFDPIKSAFSYRQSNPSVLDVVSLNASLQLFHEAGGILYLRQVSIRMGSFFLLLLKQSKYYIQQQEHADNLLGFKILNPLRDDQHGCQFSLLFFPHHSQPEKNTMDRVLNYLRSYGIICDERKPDVIRLAPVPLYNTFVEIYIVAMRLFQALDTIEKMQVNCS